MAGWGSPTNGSSYPGIGWGAKRKETKEPSQSLDMGRPLLWGPESELVKETDPRIESESTERDPNEVLESPAWPID